MENKKLNLLFKDNLNKLLQEQGKNQNELAKYIGVSPTTINKYVKGHILPRMDKVDKICSFFGVPRSYLIGNDATNEINLTQFSNIRPISTNQIPLLGEIACGKPIYANEDRESYVEIGTDIRADFCLICKGDSMINARIHDGDIVFIRAQATVENGEIAAVIIEDEATLKRVFYHKESNVIELRPENTKYSSYIYSGQDLDRIVILGKAIAFQSDVK